MKPINNIDFFDLDDENNAEIKCKINSVANLFISYNGLLLDLREYINSNLNEIKKGNFIDKIIILFLSKVIEILDSITVLTNYSCINQLNNLIRPLFETSLSLKFILVDNSNYENKAATYYIEELVAKISQLNKIIKNVKFFQERKFIKDKSKYNIQNIKDEILMYENSIKSNPVTLEIYENWGKNKYWYNSFDCKTIKDIAEKVDKIETDRMKWVVTYDDIYTHLSRESHAKNAVKMMSVSNGKAYFQKIREPTNISFKIDLIYGFVNNISFSIIEFYGLKKSSFCKNFIEKSIVLINERKNISS